MCGTLLTRYLECGHSYRENFLCDGQLETAAPSDACEFIIRPDDIADSICWHCSEMGIELEFPEPIHVSSDAESSSDLPTWSSPSPAARAAQSASRNVPSAQPEPGVGRQRGEKRRFEDVDYGGGVEARKKNGQACAVNEKRKLGKENGKGGGLHIPLEQLPDTCIPKHAVVSTS
ncbi:hypothetical protein K491DRAFT_680544 [Lophiostoma macrostomum CBS 122681]|uniref:Uncharacterized protein n=1 Tax=Lophiostoma macrostomum CBS 122681 TaxID=1314788 RepID=A0A6A6T0B2_9PLEO|nr:hypothetical protein K491DRAFT_680544 [Lophiostoma macrostomum CBS 122681]